MDKFSAFNSNLQGTAFAIGNVVNSVNEFELPEVKTRVTVNPSKGTFLGLAALVGIVWFLFKRK